MVGLAALALVGGVLIAVSRLLPEQPDQTSQATATPSASVTEASRTPRPTPSARPARTMTVDAAAIPSMTEPAFYASEWVRLRTRRTVRGSPSSTAPARGVLRRGEAVYVNQPGWVVEGWLRVDVPTRGWIAGKIENAAMFDRFPYRSQPGSDVDGLAADAEGFTASTSVSDALGDVALTSSDGLHWQRSQAPATAWDRSVAYGPAGWLMAGNVDGETGSTAMLWRSPDRRSWQPLGTLSGEGDINSARLVGTEEGYVLIVHTESGVPGVWFSADALLWTERPMTFLPADWAMRRFQSPALVATPLGFFLWSDSEISDEVVGAFSVDGWTWSEADFVGPGQVVDVVADGDHLLAVGRAPSGARMWTGTVAGQELIWSSDDTAPFRGAAVTRMVSDGDRAIVLGWDRGSETPLWWQRDGLSWQRRALPAAFGSLPQEAAGGPKGIVAIGQAAYHGGRTPVFWHLGAGVEWEREPSPVMPPPAPPTCGRVPHDLLELMALDGVLGASCFGDAPITIRGWSAPCEGCYGESAGTWATKWLADPADNRVIHLAPIDSGDWGWWDAVLHPSLRRTPPSSRWLEVTGHFDDPEAATCRWTPTVAEEPWYSGAYDIVAGCRGRFVVTSVRPVQGP